ncbi:11281_t:CDS:2 [Funneliformis caledonium]|uniref:11281_t:CDS:1 n=1 Tax=Funneliformis caledonium TaxID=1117310 RepID=A0A9N8ZY07_9GLOM|nr:11281_t:CDS:2 [Funneliformis caledonium]
MPKPKKHRINKDRSKAIYTNTKTRNLVECKCTLHYHSSRWRYSSTSRSIKNNSVVTETVLALKRKKKYNILDHDDPEIVSDPSDDREDYEILINDEESFTEKDNCTLSEDSEDDIPLEQFTALILMILILI